MLLRRPTDLIALIRARRQELGMSQSALADAIGAHRNWVGKLERSTGESAELGLVLKALDVLQVDLSGVLRGSAGSPEEWSVVDLDALLRGMSGDE